MPVSVSLVLVPQFPLLSLSCCTEAFRLANREAGYLAFDWRMVSENATTVASSSGINITPDLGFNDIQKSDIVIVLSSYEADRVNTPRLNAWLRRMDRTGALLASVDTSALVLERAGVLGSDPVTVHQEAIPAMEELLHHDLTADRLYTLGERRASSVGGTAVMDMILALIERYENPDLATRIARVFNFRRSESGRDGPTAIVGEALYHVDPRLGRMLELVLANLETPLSAQAVADLSGIPVATANRLFQRHTGQSLAAYYLAVRLERACGLLSDTHLPTGHVAFACGFSSGASFARAFRRVQGLSPSDYRREGRRFAMTEKEC